MDNSKVFFMNNSDEWSTPDDIYISLNNEFNFDLDPCSSIYNHKTDLFFTLNDDGLTKNWGGYRVFCNPPYSQISKWVEKCYRESCKDNTLVVLLIPSRTDTKYFHDFIYNRSEIRFIKGRIRFGDAVYNAPFPSMVVIFRGPYVN